MEKLKIKEALSCITGRICLTSDCWSSITTDGYLSLPAHFIDNSWNLQKIILNFTFLPPLHTGLAMSDHVFGLSKDLEFKKRFFSITLDNASANDSMVDYLKTEIYFVCEGGYFHVRRCAHVMNLKLVGDFIINYILISELLIRNYPSLDFVIPKTYRVEISNKESVYTIPMLNYLHCPTTEEWGSVGRIFKLLKVFYHNCVFSDYNYPIVTNENDLHDRFMRKMATRMYVKFEKYWDEFSTVMAVAAVCM
ncbi:hypothetical protein LXL04_031072 [Taraxacum kok-saghyz]